MIKVRDNQAFVRRIKEVHARIMGQEHRSV